MQNKREESRVSELIMVTTWIPRDKATETNKKFLEGRQRLSSEPFEKPLLPMRPRDIIDDGRSNANGWTSFTTRLACVEMELVTSEAK